MKVIVSILAEGNGGRVYTVSLLDENGDAMVNETRSFLDSHIVGPHINDALDLDSKIQVMSSRFGFKKDSFRNEGTVRNRHNLIGLPDETETGRILRLYGYRKSQKLLLIGGGCVKTIDPTGELTALDDFPECKASANLIKAVDDALKIKYRLNNDRKIIEKVDGFYDSDNNLLREFELTIRNV